MLAKRVLKLKPSPTLALAAKAKGLKAQGKDVISLSVGEPDWDTFDSIKKAAKIAIDNGETKYTPASGIPELRKAIAEQTSKDLGVDYAVEETTVSVGGKFVIFSALQALIDPGDEVIVPTPYWVSYPSQIELAEGVAKIVTAQKAKNFKLTAEDLEKSINKKTKMLILNSPSNPTGAMYSKDELHHLARVLTAHPQVLILSDDIYNRLVFNQEGLAPHILHVAPQLKERTIVINGVSKTYSMTGWRLGWALGDKQIISAMDKYQSQSVSCAASVTQKAAVQALQGADLELKEALVKLRKRRDFAYGAMKKLPNVNVEEPDGAFYIWPDFSFYLGKTWRDQKIESSKQFAEFLLESQMVAAVPGVEFGVEGYMRISYALSEDRMRQAFERIHLFLNEIK